MTKRRLLTMGLLGGLTTALSACNTLTMFNAVTPKDGPVRRVAQDIAFGDDPRQRYDVYRPANRDGEKLPVVVFIYGGNWASGSKADYSWMGHAFAAMGYVCMLPDYRLVPDVRYPAFVEDVGAAVRHFVAHAGDYGADATRLALSGHSAGAYNAVMVALDPQYLGDIPVKAVVGISGPYDFYPFDVPASRDAFGQWPRPQETLPVNHVRKLDTHFLLLHSRADTVVYIHNAVNLDAKLRAIGDDCRLKLYDGLSHQDMAAAMSIPFRGKGTIFADVKAFLAETL
ncbi:alpha/beta hydrolase [Asticcacaulis solisilvae]|uniref:alpha/beta hydrolase n=1 Tax=Asticcacaulis solisilvae TaxID=1217274 RepID=UPI003FD7087E